MSRSGVVATKIGMSQVFTTDGKAIPVTLLQLKRNIVLGVRSKEKDGYQAVQIGYDKRKHMKKPQEKLAQSAGIDSFFRAKEFRVSDDNLMNIGTEITVSHFSKGQLIDVRAVSIGKGYGGVMKKYGFAGLEASHGVSASHRAPGSTGQRQDPGKVFKGKKMASRMGGTNVNIQNLQIVDIDQDLAVIAVKGAVPGNKGGIVYITDAIKFGHIAG